MEKCITNNPNAVRQSEIIAADKLLNRDKLILYHGTKEDNLGLQVFIKSEQAFSLLKKIKGPVPVPEKYRDFYLKRDRNAREKYIRDKQNQSSSRLKQRIYEFL